MKTLKDLFEIMAEAVERQNNPYASKNWFFDYSGHVNHVRVDYYQFGWNRESTPNFSVYFKMNNPEEITAAYYLIKANL